MADWQKALSVTEKSGENDVLRMARKWQKIPRYGELYASGCKTQLVPRRIRTERNFCEFQKKKIGLSVHFRGTEIRGGQAAEMPVIQGKASANLPPEMRKKTPIYPRK